MSIKAVLVVTMVGASGAPLFPPQISHHDDLSTCQAVAKAHVEALALAHDETVMPARRPGTLMGSVTDGATGAWVIQYERASRTDPNLGETVKVRTVRGICREVPRRID